MPAAKERTNAMKNRILLVLTGGTIGSVCADHVRGLTDDSPYLLLRELNRQCPAYGDSAFDVTEPLRLLSENLTPSHWVALYQALSQADLTPYDGVIITHGSDTLAYTAAAMGMLLRHLPVPVVLIAADRPADDPLSNAVPNLRAAVDFIRHGGRKGVFVSYRRYDDGAQVIYLATRLVSADNCRDEFSAYGGQPLGIMADGQFTENTAPWNPTARQLDFPYAPLVRGAFTLDRKVMLLRAYPGMDYTAIHPDDFAAVVQYGYHSATACTEGDATSLLSFARRCRECGTSLWLGSFKRAENELYATSRDLLAAGILPFYDMSPEAAYAKAVLAYNLPLTGLTDMKEPEAFMGKGSLYYECVGTQTVYRREDGRA